VRATILDGRLGTREFDVDNINLIHEPEGLEVELVTKSRQVTVRGPLEALERIHAGQLRIVADVTAGNATTVGRFSIPAKVYVDGSDDVGVIGEYNISITVSE